MTTYVVAVLLAALAGCAKINDTGMLLLSSSVPAVAVLNGTLLTGKAEIFTGRTGRINLASGSTPGFTCAGDMRYTATKTGVANLTCSDGSEASLAFNAISETRGFGRASTANGPASFTFGMAPADAAAYLTLPADKRFGISPEGQLRLE